MNSIKPIIYRLIYVAMMAFLVISCTNQEQDILITDGHHSEAILKQYGDIHNSGLDFIVADAEASSTVYSKDRIQTVYDKWVLKQYGKANGAAILRRIDSDKELAFDGIFPKQHILNRSCIETDDFTNKANPLAHAALNECLDKISNHLKHIDENNLFDNEALLDDLHVHIINTYEDYAKKCSGDDNAKALEETLGVLYGSIEYWTNSKNVKAWSEITLKDEVSGVSSRSTEKEGEKKKPEIKDTEDKKDEIKKTEDKTTLSKFDWIMIVSAADAAGASIGTPALGGACSAAVGLYFDVE